MNPFLQTIISATAILGTIVIVYFSFRSFIRTVTGKGAGCHNSNNSDCAHCGLVEENNKLIKSGNK